MNAIWKKSKGYRKTARWLFLGSLIAIALIIILSVGGIALSKISHTLLFDELIPETESPAYSSYGVLHFNGDDLSVSRAMQASGIDGDLIQILVVYHGRVWFVYQGSPQSKLGLASTDLLGNDLDVHLLEEFSDIEFGSHYMRKSNIYCTKFEDRCCFYYNGKIVLTDKKKVVEYDLQSHEKQIMSFDQYKFPQPNIDVETTSDCVSISTPEQTHCITRNIADYPSTTYGQMLKWENQQTWEKISVLEDLFYGVQFDSANLYLICCVRDAGGTAYAVVYRYDTKTQHLYYTGIHVAQASYIDDTFYLVPVVDSRTGDVSQGTELCVSGQ